MDVYGKSLIFTVFILILLNITERLINKISPKKINVNKINSNKININENFQNTVVTKITNMFPFTGDSSTLITIKGINFDFIGKILFKNDVEEGNNSKIGECVILDEDRTNSSLKFIPPTISELGLNVLNIREKMKKDNEGYKVSIFFIRKDKNKLKAISQNDKNNFIQLPGINFYYIDKIPYQNNCPKPKPKPIEETTNLLKVIPEEPEYTKNSDLEFVNTVLPSQMEKIDKISKELEKILNENKHYQNNDTEFMKTVQALDFLNKYKKRNNSYRYNIHKRINDRYNYNLFN